MTGTTRNAEIQVLYREVNERIASLNLAWGVPALEVLCECGAGACAERVELLRDEYESVRGRPTHFVLRHGHQDPAVEDVVRDHGTFLVVANYGAAATIARRTDPRANAR
jgi:hypothetical protein